ncbi:amino acid/amide ABC transporter membrane protein 1, HAAT family /amino acid/amide ABC transporter membrane protein 2, HAAT family [Rhizobiales bacterium GAS191]|nr:amino acid/amide ABC transporter membrane protein 1, HAAT family /amino acid/amide ABC transporter membrane protein 2, HAAT family [Rhizobiales bacterium GAS191]
MQVDILVIQALNGLATASSLFLVASGLSIIFGVTRVVNFAHGSFYMLGAYIAVSLTQRLAGLGAFGFWGSLIIAALAVGLIGVLVETLILRRLNRAPELYPLLATFGVVLIVQDAALAIWGPEDLLGPRAPGLSGFITILGSRFPVYELALIVAGPALLGLLFLVFRRTRFGLLVRAATQDREMVGALGIDERRLFSSVFFLGACLAGLGGALQLPREAVNLNMDISVVVEAFVVVVVGGLGSLVGAYVAAVLIGVIQAFGILLLPKITLVLVFLVMGVVLAVRPYGLFGRQGAAEAPRESGTEVMPGPLSPALRVLAALAIAAIAAMPLFAGDYPMGLITELLILAVFAASLHLLMGLGGMASFGHAAWFGIGAYGAALALKSLQLPMPVALIGAPLAACFCGLLAGWLCVRLSGVYLAMLSLAVAQIAWATSFQWVELTGGDNGILGVWPMPALASKGAYLIMTLAVSALALAALRVIAFSPFGYALRAARDNSRRAEASGIDVRRVQWMGFVLAAGFAGLAGGLYAFAKGSVFPTYLAIGKSVDALIMVLLGGIGSLTGPVIGAFAFGGLEAELMARLPYWRALLGLVILALVLAAPTGITGLVSRAFATRWRRAASPA